MQNWKLARSRSYWYLGLVSAIAVLGVTIAFSVLSPQLFYSPNLIHLTYETIAQTQSNPIKEVLQNLQLPWQNPITSTQKFETTPTTSPAAQAFAAGLWSGQQILLGNDNPILPQLLSPPLKELSWLQTRWKGDFELGQWILLLWTVTQVSPPLTDTFWDKQKQIFIHFQADFSTTNQSSAVETQRVTSALKFIKPFIEKVPLPAKQEPQLYDQLGRELAFMMDNLSP
ncbi:hypothetical protein THII_1402 [Thioploca ingrica]|uniref:Uncharacterized protein n=1 Tax=Thioploca ingrica TaxID=40754 RepID=A0A090AF81_9GAMM|nr:hypothetical protein THII_1402 [Thioploca ingrica]